MAMCTYIRVRLGCAVLCYMYSIVRILTAVHGGCNGRRQELAYFLIHSIILSVLPTLLVPSNIKGRCNSLTWQAVVPMGTTHSSND